MFIIFHAIMCKSRTLWVYNCWYGNRVLHEIATQTQGNSRSFILQSITGRQGLAYRHIILLSLSLKFPKK